MIVIPYPRLNCLISYHIYMFLCSPYMVVSLPLPGVNCTHEEEAEWPSVVNFVMFVCFDLYVVCTIPVKRK